MGKGHWQTFCDVCPDTKHAHDCDACGAFQGVINAAVIRQDESDCESDDAKGEADLKKHPEYDAALKVGFCVK